MDVVYKEVLRANHVEIINSLDLNRSSVLDHLLADDVVSSGEQEEILSQRTLREQNTTLLYIIKRRGDPSFGSLQNALEKDYGFLATKLAQEITSYRTCSSNGADLLKSTSYQCLHCLLLDNLIPDDITHALFQEGLISDDDLEYFNNRNISRQKRVSELLKTIVSNKEITKNDLMETLQKKYAFISLHAQEHQNEKIAICSCSKSELVESSEKQRMPYEHDEATEKDNTMFQKDEKYKRKPHLLQISVKRTFPKDKSLMKKCSKLWNALFELREKGDWIAFNQVTTEALKKFTDPDLLIMLYRSEMCISTFYTEDAPKAYEMFEKAMQVLPKTQMPNWHLARILPLKIHLIVKENKWDEASGLLKDAHQVMDTLEPCLSTGSVYFFEGIYLGTILSHTPGGTKSHKLSKRVKECFLTSIDHYKKEKFFGIKSFLNQVYLFLALFCLGVDCKKIRYMHVQLVSQEDVEIAGHYLDMFERECWEMSTNWSRMLFYIARAEENKHRNSFKRSLDYFKQAKDCALIGVFKEHEHFIDINIGFLSDKILQNISCTERKWQTANDILQQILDSSDESDVDSMA